MSIPSNFATLHKILYALNVNDNIIFQKLSGFYDDFDQFLDEYDETISTKISSVVVSALPGSGSILSSYALVVDGHPLSTTIDIPVDKDDFVLNGSISGKTLTLGRISSSIVNIELSSLFSLNEAGELSANLTSLLSTISGSLNDKISANAENIYELSTLVEETSGEITGIISACSGELDDKIESLSSDLSTISSNLSASISANLDEIIKLNDITSGFTSVASISTAITAALTSANNYTDTASTSLISTISGVSSTIEYDITSLSTNLSTLLSGLSGEFKTNEAKVSAEIEYISSVISSNISGQISFISSVLTGYSSENTVSAAISGINSIVDTLSTNSFCGLTALSAALSGYTNPSAVSIAIADLSTKYDKLKANGADNAITGIIGINGISATLPNNDKTVTISVIGYDTITGNIADLSAITYGYNKNNTISANIDGISAIVDGLSANLSTAISTNYETLSNLISYTSATISSELDEKITSNDNDISFISSVLSGYDTPTSVSAAISGLSSNMTIAEAGLDNLSAIVSGYTAEINISSAISGLRETIKNVSGNIVNTISGVSSFLSGEVSANDADIHYISGQFDSKLSGIDTVTGYINENVVKKYSLNSIITGATSGTGFTVGRTDENKLSGALNISLSSTTTTSGVVVSIIDTNSNTVIGNTINLLNQQILSSATYRKATSGDVTDSNGGVVSGQDILILTFNVSGKPANTYINISSLINSDELNSSVSNLSSQIFDETSGIITGIQTNKSNIEFLSSVLSGYNSVNTISSAISAIESDIATLSAKVDKNINTTVFKDIFDITSDNICSAINGNIDDIHALTTKQYLYRKLFSTKCDLLKTKYYNYNVFNDKASGFILGVVSTYMNGTPVVLKVDDYMFNVTEVLTSDVTNFSGENISAYTSGFMCIGRIADSLADVTNGGQGLATFSMLVSGGVKDLPLAVWSSYSSDTSILMKQAGAMSANLTTAITGVNTKVDNISSYVSAFEEYNPGLSTINGGENTLATEMAVTSYISGEIAKINTKITNEETIITGYYVPECNGNTITGAFYRERVEKQVEFTSTSSILYEGLPSSITIKSNNEYLNGEYDIMSTTIISPFNDYFSGSDGSNIRTNTFENVHFFDGTPQKTIYIWIRNDAPNSSFVSIIPYSCGLNSEHKYLFNIFALSGIEDKDKVSSNIAEYLLSGGCLKQNGQCVYTPFIKNVNYNDYITMSSWFNCIDLSGNNVAELFNEDNKLSGLAAGKEYYLSSQTTSQSSHFGFAYETTSSLLSGNNIFKDFNPKTDDTYIKYYPGKIAIDNNIEGSSYNDYIYPSSSILQPNQKAIYISVNDTNHIGSYVWLSGLNSYKCIYEEVRNVMVPPSTETMSEEALSAAGYSYSNILAQINNLNNQLQRK